MNPGGALARRSGRAVFAGPTQLPALDRASLRDRARLAIRGSIVTGELAEGEIYPVAYFSERLGVSATPIREALFDLAGSGLVEVVRNRGFRIPPLTSQELDELYELRTLLEVPAMGRLARRPQRGTFQELRLLADEMVSQARERQVAEFLWTDRGFHLGVLERLGNHLLVEVVAGLRDRTRLAGIKGMAASGVLVETAREHLELLDALEVGDGEATERWMTNHLRHTRGLWAGRPEGGDQITTSDPLDPR
jgi:DNA-binding GntR family transcriptional regulator